MPLSPPDERQHLHTRRVECRGYYRNDGLWDIEGHVTDVKTYPQHYESRGAVAPDEPIHDMWIRLTIDDRMIIQDVEAQTDYSPYRICPEITPNFKKLIGLRVGSGFQRKAREVVGGVHGCTHLVELLGPVGTVAFQTIQSAKAAELRRQRAEGTGDASAVVNSSPSRVAKRVLNTCHAWSSENEVIRHYAPELYTGRR